MDSVEARNLYSSMASPRSRRLDRTRLPVRAHTDSTVRTPVGAPQAPDYSGLHEVDWSFPDSNTRTATHGLHPYPAKFIPQIPRTLIRLLHPGDGSAVLDPFCGSGTTLVESALADLPSVGVDLNPLACLLTSVKLAPIHGSLVEPARSIAAAARNDPSPSVPEIPRLSHWFKPQVQRTLASLMHGIDNIANQAIADALRVSFASIVVRVSNQESDTRYAAVDKKVTPDSVIAAFLAAAESTERAVHQTWSTLFAPPTSHIINNNILDVHPDDIPLPISLVITSPPYPNAYEYWLYHKYRMYWLGMDPLHVRTHEIGARLHYFKRDPQTAADFENQMATVFALLYDVLADGGHACFQIGDSIIRGNLVDNTALITRAALQNRFRRVACLSRTIPSTRKAFNTHYARIRREKILVFRLDK